MNSLVLLLIFICACAPQLSVKDTTANYEPTGSTSSSQNSVSDVSQNNTLADQSNSISVNQAPSPSVLLISEVLYDSIGDEQDGNTFVELYGTPNSSLKGYVLDLVDGATSKVTKTIQLNESDLLNDLGLFVLCDVSTNAKNSSHIQNCDSYEQFDLQNGPDVVRLSNSQGQVLDVLCYEFTQISDLCPYFSSEAVEPGQSVERNNYLNSFDNSKYFQAQSIPTPGQLFQSVEATQLHQPVQSTDDQSVSSDVENSQNDSIIEDNFHSVRISEVITDPQHDWNDSSGGDGIPFNNNFGSGTIGTTDEWIELKNVSNKKLNLSNWALNFADGTDETLILDSTDEAILFSENGNVENFNEQELLVVSDIPGDMKNNIKITLLDSNQDVVDEVYIDDGNANSVDDEANVMQFDGTISKKAATILF